MTLTERLLGKGVKFAAEIPTQASPLLSFLISFVLPIAFFAIVGRWLMNSMTKRMGGEALTLGKSNAKIYIESQTGKTFADVAGQDEAKEALTEIVDFLHDPGKYADIGAKLPKGALLVGPPGTGKTLLAKAVAGEAKVPFFSISGSEFVEMFVGMGAAKVRDLFKQAEEKAPCIVFIDEIDTIGKKRDNGGMVGGNDEREQTLNQLLAEMDGFDGKKGAVISDKEKKIIAYHEIGHALVAARQKHSAPVTKITIIPRTSGALGYTMQVEEDERVLMSKEDAMNQLVTLTGGRTAEELIFHSITSGASNDIEKATRLARAMVTRYGMSDQFDMVALETVTNQYLGGDTSLACSADTSAKIDAEVNAIIKSAHDTAREILSSNMEQLHKLAAYLLEKETITGEELMKILDESAENA